ncbi:MAG: tripartite tricarboxylate transporter substrate-binding protein [Burkholderiales bacterium]|nr:tripartite tricarboxylate transporter substrate-binding protein [Burkholderiales bacterium]
MNRLYKSFSIIFSVLSTLLIFIGVSNAQQYPTKTITLVVPFAAGGPTDVLARMISIPMGKSMGQTVIVENTVGAGGTVATQRIARANKLPFDPLKDFEYIGQVLDVPMTMLARKDFPANNLKELIEYVKVNKDKVSLANAGLGAVSHLCGMMFQTAIGVDLNTIPYKGTGPAMNDLMGGQVDLLCDQTTQTVPIIKDNRVKVYGVTTLNRLQALPNVPTLDEQGLKGFEVKVWHGMYAPKGTPKPALDKINSALREALADPMVKQRMVDLSSDIPPLAKITPQSLQTHLEAEIAKWGPVIRKAGIYAD